VIAFLLTAKLINDARQHHAQRLMMRCAPSMIALA
jgi:hypothetical protein